MANTTTDPFASPDAVQLKGKVSGITRLSRKAKMLMSMVAILGLGGVMIAIFTASEGDATSSAESAADDTKGAPGGVQMLEAGTVTKGVPDGQASAKAAELGIDASLGGGVDVSSQQAATPAAQNAGVKAAPASAAAASNVPLVPTVPAPNGSGAVPAPAPGGETPEQTAARRLRDDREDKARRAREAQLESGSAADGAAGVGAASAANPQLADLMARAQSALDASQGKGASGSAGALGLGGQGQEQDDINKQIRKEAFLREAASATKTTYLQQSMQKPIGPYEIKAGWNIPMVLECGINSDLPGQTCARVTENVYDTATGRHMLIPQGTKAIGMYDSRIAFGQSRLLVAWTRLIFPDGSSFVLEGMPGTDAAGNAGFDGDVNNHYGRLFLGAAMLSVISAGAQLSQPQQAQTGTNAPSAQQTIAAAMGQQLAQVSGSLINRNMQIQPTITQAPGYRFNITITKDMLFPKPFRR